MRFFCLNSVIWGFLSPGILSLGILSVGILSAGFLSCGFFVGNPCDPESTVTAEI